MALSGVEIFKHLPKTNCKKCGHPTCLAFAMKLAAKQASLDACPDASDDAQEDPGRSPQRRRSGISRSASGDKAVKVGGEICMFRHEKKFFNPNVFAVAIKASEAGDAAAKKIEAVKTSEIDRVGQKLRVDAIAVTDEGGDAAKFASVVKQVVDGAPGVPVILVSKNPATIEAGIAHCADKKPLIYAATAENAEAMAKIAKEKKASLAVAADGLDALTALSEKVKGHGCGRPGPRLRRAQGQGHDRALHHHPPCGHQEELQAPGLSRHLLCNPRQHAFPRPWQPPSAR